MSGERAIEAAADGLEHALVTLRKGAPKDLEEAMRYLASVHDIVLPKAPLPLLIKHLQTSGPNDRVLHALTLALQSWDHQAGTWTGGTLPHSQERRRVVLERLGFSVSEQTAINNRILRFSESDLPIVIAEAHEHWYPERKKKIGDFYWDHYTRQLLPPHGTWDRKAVGVLNVSIDDVISRLSDPCRPAIFAVKGLVIGYVQSGKTSHFSGLITKAADAGYRFIIVLAGTLDILREQTQRRIDKEIVGKELLGKEEYGRDVDWEAFVSHGGRPSLIGAFDWERLTDSTEDYQKLSRRLSLLEFTSVERGKPFNHPDNLRSASAKLAVIKKVPDRLNKLCDDLEALSELRSRLEHVPTLIIDDESDQASINTVDQSKPESKGKRTGTNKAIGRLLSLLPRAQYVGYTATPFANVFIDPEDAEDLFPKDFIVSLPRPDNYMGVSDFFDFDTEYAAKDYQGNQNAFVRPVEGDNELATNLPQAIDSFVLTGAIKLFRESKDSSNYRFRHHTMLVHHSATRVVHEVDRQVVDTIFASGARYQSQSGMRALRQLFKDDFVPVSATRAPAAPFPSSFEELRPFITQCLTRICAGKSVRVVNGEGKNRDDTPDFDETSVWAILVGGTKLSRGYTVEGLTVSYYRRPTGAGDTLMQMGRWFGFRQGYRDLVRLFIGRKEKKGKVTVDLYEAFGAVCRDEEALRADLTKYATGGLKPRQVPPLVRQHLPQLPPTARNKRFNAEIQSLDFAGDWTEKTSAPTKSAEIRGNRAIARTLLEASAIGDPEGIEFTSTNGKTRNFDAIIGRTTVSDVLTFLQKYVWAGGRQSIALEIDYIRRSKADGRLAEWLVMLPQIGTANTENLGAKDLPAFAVIERARVSDTRFGVYAEPRHRDAAAALAGVTHVKEATRSLSSYLASSRPVLVLYFVREKHEPTSEVSVGFGIQYPGVKKDRAISWGVSDKSHADAVVVSD